jgi:NAD(P)-dependent dehydrogenase (short-subunit alcohol dehydrogenase family)
MAQILALAVVLGAASALPSGPIGPPCFAKETGIELGAHLDVDLTGQIAIVTGSDKTIGLEIARALAARKATVVMGGRTYSKMIAAAKNITDSLPGAKVDVPAASLDLSSMNMTRVFAQEVFQKYDSIDILVNNAGMASTSKPTLTKDGFEIVYEIDYMNTWLLTELLLPRIRKAKGRVVNVVSKAAALACEMGGHVNTPACMALDNLPPPPISGEVPVIGLPRSNYGIAKLCAIRWTEDMARREKAAGTGVVAYSTHPGYVATGIPASPMWAKLACSTDGREGAPCPTTPPMGALTPVFLALSPLEKLENGGFYEWCYKSTLPDPMAAGKSQEWQEGLYNLTAKWLKNYTEPLAEMIDQIVI